MSSAGQQLVAGRVPGERIATTISTADSSAFTTTETVIDSVVASLVSGRVYRIRWMTGSVSSVANDTARWRIREDNLTGTELQQGHGAPNPSTVIPSTIVLEAEYTAVSTGNKTFVGTCVRGSGTGNINAEGAATRPRYLYVDYIR